MNFADLDMEKLTTATEMLKAIAHPIRFSIVRQLERGVKLTVTEIHGHLGVEQSAASHHLAILKKRGVLSAQRDGKNTYYFLKHPDLTGILDCIENCNCQK